MRLMEQFDVAISSNKAQCNEAKSKVHFHDLRFKIKDTIRISYLFILWQHVNIIRISNSNVLRLFDSQRRTARYFMIKT